MKLWNKRNKPEKVLRILEVSTLVIHHTKSLYRCGMGQYGPDSMMRCHFPKTGMKFAPEESPIPSSIEIVRMDET